MMLLLTFVVVSSPLYMDYELIEARARFDEEYPDKTILAWPIVKECEANFTIIRYLYFEYIVLWVLCFKVV